MDAEDTETSTACSPGGRGAVEVGVFCRQFLLYPQVLPIYNFLKPKKLFFLFFKFLLCQYTLVIKLFVFSQFIRAALSNRYMVECILFLGRVFIRDKLDMDNCYNKQHPSVEPPKAKTISLFLRNIGRDQAQTCRNKQK